MSKRARKQLLAVRQIAEAQGHFAIAAVPEPRRERRSTRKDRLWKQVAP